MANKIIDVILSINNIDEQVNMRCIVKLANYYFYSYNELMAIRTKIKIS